MGFSFQPCQSTQGRLDAGILGTGKGKGGRRVTSGFLDKAGDQLSSTENKYSDR